MDATAGWPESTLDRASLAELAYRLPVGSQDPDKRALRRSATDRLLGWLQRWPGATWQQRWIASGSEPLGASWVAAPAAALQASAPVTATVARRTTVVGISTLLCLGVLRPGYAWLFACRLKATYGHVRQLADPEFFIAEATQRGWLGEVDGLQVSLDAARQKLEQMRKLLGQPPAVPLGMPRIWRPPTTK